jgi:hypothetical protein
MEAVKPRLSAQAGSGSVIEGRAETPVVSFAALIAVLPCVLLLSGPVLTHRRSHRKHLV